MLNSSVMDKEPKHGFSAEDTAHGFAKRKILKAYCGGLFAREIEACKFKPPKHGQYQIAYVDGFSFKGEYRKQHFTRTYNKKNQEDTMENDPDIALMGSPIIALERGLDRLKISREERGCSFKMHQFNAIHYVFNDYIEEHIDNLKQIVFKYLADFSWDLLDGELDSLDNGLPLIYNQGKSFLWRDSSNMLKKQGKMWLIRTTFVVGKFEHLPAPTNAVKIFSFIDPSGIKQIPFSAVSKFLGPGKEVFINLMVCTIRRVSGNKTIEGCLEKLFGNPEDEIIIKNFADMDSKEAYQKYVALYETELGAFLHKTESDVKAIHFLFSKGKRDKIRGDQFYMVYLSCDMDLDQVKKMKDAMMSNVQTPDGELRHTDYYSWNGIHIPYGRKTTDQEEARVIHNHFSGEMVSLGEVKYWVLVESPFTFHSRALGQLEKRGNLSVFDKDGIRKRRGDFRANDVRSGLKNSSNHWFLFFSEIGLDNTSVSSVMLPNIQTATGTTNFKQIKEQTNKGLPKHPLGLIFTAANVDDPTVKIPKVPAKTSNQSAPKPLDVAAIKKQKVIMNFFTQKNEQTNKEPKKNMLKRKFSDIDVNEIQKTQNGSKVLMPTEKKYKVDGTRDPIREYKEDHPFKETKSVGERLKYKCTDRVPMIMKKSPKASKSELDLMDKKIYFAPCTTIFKEKKKQINKRPKKHPLGQKITAINVDNPMLKIQELPAKALDITPVKKPQGIMNFFKQKSKQTNKEPKQFLLKGKFSDTDVNEIKKIQNGSKILIPKEEKYRYDGTRDPTREYKEEQAKQSRAQACKSWLSWASKARAGQ